MRKNTTFLLIVLAVLAAFALAFFSSKKEPETIQVKPKDPVKVTVRSAKDSSSLSQDMVYPAVTAGDQEATVTAQTSGTVTELNFDLGSKVFANMQLLEIDSLGSAKVGESDLKSSSIQALELAVDSAKASYKVAKDTYEDDKSYANKKAKEIAKINLEAAEVNLQGALDSHVAFSPISGVITERSVSLGDSVTLGQTIAKISKTGISKIQFYVNKEELGNFKSGMPITINEDGNLVVGSISKISPQADSDTRRFLIEAKPDQKTKLIIGNVVSVLVETKRTPASPENLILPLSAITVGQNENYMFIAENGRAKKVKIEIIDVIGEAAEIKADLIPDAQIIIDGSKLIKDGDEVTISEQ